MPLLPLELALNTPIEEECDVSILFSFYEPTISMRPQSFHTVRITCNVTLRYVLFGQPFCKNIVHFLRGESDKEGERRFVARHGENPLEFFRTSHPIHSGQTYKVLGNWSVYHVLDLPKYGGDFAHTIRTIVEEEQCIPLCNIDDEMTAQHIHYRAYLALAPPTH